MKKATKKEILEIHQLFVDRYDDAVTELEYKNAFELVIAVALSAQCTDKRVNIITPPLFAKYTSPQELADANIDGEIPMDEKELQTLAGVGQKTANVVMIEYTGANLMAVDTHVFRVSHRLGLSDDKTAIKTEATLVRKFKNNLHALHQGMVLFGRYICTAKNPKCEECFLTQFCKTKETFKV